MLNDVFVTALFKEAIGNITELKRALHGYEGSFKKSFASGNFIAFYSLIVKFLDKFQSVILQKQIEIETLKTVLSMLENPLFSHAYYQHFGGKHSDKTLKELEEELQAYQYIRKKLVKDLAYAADTCH